MTDTHPMPTRPSRRARRWVLRGLLVLGTAGVLYEVGRVVAGSNRHTVVPGRVYRCAQPTAVQLRDSIERHGIRTVVNLRGLCDGVDWYQTEAAATSGANVSQEDITLSANTLPPPTELRRLVEVLDHSAYPLLIHCRRGADRTGLVSAIVLLLYTDATLDEARRQLLPVYGHFRFGRTAALDDFVDKYEGWLADRPHAPPLFRDWVLNRYCPGVARSQLAWIDPPTTAIPALRTRTLKVSAVNTSDTPWELKPGTFAGVHLAWAVYDAAGETVQYERTGLRFETVPPGGKTEFVLPVRALEPGRYTVTAELHDATAAGIAFRTTSFVKLGDGSLVMELEVKDN